MIRRANLGLSTEAAVIAAGVAPVPGVALELLWNQVTGFWDSLYLPGSVLGPPVPAPLPMPAPSAAGAGPYGFDPVVQAADNARNYAIWQQTVFNPYVGVAPEGSTDTPPIPPGPVSSLVPWLIAGGAVLVAYLAVRR